MTSLQPDKVRPGDVWLVKWEHEDSGGYKYRPGLILRTRGDSAIVLKITTSSTTSYPGDYQVKDWEEAGLKKPSIARTSQIKVVSFEDFGHDEPFGRMAERDIVEVRKLIDG